MRAITRKIRLLSNRPPAEAFSLNSTSLSYSFGERKHGAGQTLCQALKSTSATTLASAATTSINTIMRSRLSTLNTSTHSRCPGPELERD
jgi:hypothetical protein